MCMNILHPGKRDKWEVPPPWQVGSSSYRRDWGVGTTELSFQCVKSGADRSQGLAGGFRIMSSLEGQGSHTECRENCTGQNRDQGFAGGIWPLDLGVYRDSWVQSDQDRQMTEFLANFCFAGGHLGKLRDQRNVVIAVSLKLLRAKAEAKFYKSHSY